MPNALPRSFGSVNVVVSSDSADGTSSAANAPLQARAVTSMAKLTDAPPTAETPAKPTSPVKNITFRPGRAPRSPPARRAAHGRGGRDRSRPGLSRSGKSSDSGDDQSQAWRQAW